MERDRNERNFRENLIAYQQVKEVLADYPFRYQAIRNVGRTWVAHTDQGVVRVERFNHSVPEFFFVLASVEYLAGKGFSAFPQLCLNTSERPLTEKDYGLFFVTEYPDGQTVDVQEIDVLTRMVCHMAELHRTSVGFTPPEPLKNIRQDWGDWEEKWQYRLDELYRLGEEAQHRRGDFDKEYLKGLDDALRDGVHALETLKRLGFREIVEVERLRGGLCHRDYRPVNLLEKEHGYWLLDFDDFAGQSHLEDIARLIKEVGAWDADRINYILKEYSQIYAIAPEEREAIFAYLKLPSDLWRVARNYYVKGKPQKRSLKGVINAMKDRKRCFHQLAHPQEVTLSVEELPWMWSIPPEPMPMGSIDEYWNDWNKAIYFKPAIEPSDFSTEAVEPMLQPETEKIVEEWMAALKTNQPSPMPMEAETEQESFDISSELVTDETEDVSDRLITNESNEIFLSTHAEEPMTAVDESVLEDKGTAKGSNQQEVSKIVVWKSFPKK